MKTYLILLVSLIAYLTVSGTTNATDAIETFNPGNSVPKKNTNVLGLALMAGALSVFTIVQILKLSIINL